MNDTGIRQEVIEEIRKLAVINPQIILKNERKYPLWDRYTIGGYIYEFPRWGLKVLHWQPYLQQLCSSCGVLAMYCAGSELWNSVSEAVRKSYLAVAANGIANISKNLVVCFCLGLGNAGSIIVGNRLGADRLQEAKEAGGDSKFGMLCDSVTLWCITVPLGCICAFILKLPVVYKHYKKYKWIKNLT